MEYIEAFLELSKVIAEANDGWEPSKRDRGYYNVFYNSILMEFCFSTSIYNWRQVVFIPSSLLIKSEDLAIKIAKEHINLYHILYGNS